MTSRERVCAALAWRSPDRVPIDLNVTRSAYGSLKHHLGLQIDDDPAPNAAMEVIPHPDVLARLGIDLISVKLGGVGQRGGELPGTIIDAWGIRRQLVRPSVGEYYEAVSHPLAGVSIAELPDYPWPDPTSLAGTETLRRQAERLYRDTDLALAGRFGGPILELAADLLGIEEWYARLALDQEFVSALLERISTICTAHDLLGIEAAGEYLQILKVSGEDFGGQHGPLYSLGMFRQVLLPPLRRRWHAAREKLSQVNPAAKIMLHSCGAIRPFIPELLATGAVDVLDPVQPLAEGMDPRGLYADFGGRLIFHGGIDVQQLLPYDTPEAVARETRRCLEGFHAERGGFILAPSHTIQADVPPRNVMAMIEAARGWDGPERADQGASPGATR